MKAYILTVTDESNVRRSVALPENGTFKRFHDTLKTIVTANITLEEEHIFCFEFEDLVVTNDTELVDAAKRKSHTGKPVKSPVRLKFDDALQTQKTATYTYDNATFHIELTEIVEDYYFGFPTLLQGAQKAQVNEALKSVKYGKTEWDHINHDNYTIVADRYRGPEAGDAVAEPQNAQQATTTTSATQQVALHEALYYVKAAVQLYGIISVRDFLRLYETHHAHAKLSVGELQALLLDANNVVALKAHNVEVYNDVFVHTTLDQAENRHAFVRRTLKKPFYIPAYSEFMNYADEAYVEATPYQQKLAQMLAADFYNGQVEAAADEVMALVRRLQGVDSDINTFVNEFLTKHMPAEKERLNDYVQAISDVAKTTRLWENRGYTLTELQAKIAPQKAVQQKVGRNDDCPCGSGKKYKKCCGK